MNRVCISSYSYLPFSSSAWKALSCDSDTACTLKPRVRLREEHQQEVDEDLCPVRSLSAGAGRGARKQILCELCRADRALCEDGLLKSLLAPRLAENRACVSAFLPAAFPNPVSDPLAAPHRRCSADPGAAPHRSPPCFARSESSPPSRRLPEGRPLCGAGHGPGLWMLPALEALVMLHVVIPVVFTCIGVCM